MNPWEPNQQVPANELPATRQLASVLATELPATRPAGKCANHWKLDVSKPMDFFMQYFE